MLNLQITLFSTTGKYKPISTIIRVENLKDYQEHKKEWQQKAILNICHYRKTLPYILKQQGYTILKARRYAEN